MAKLVKEIHISTVNKPGTLARVTEPLKNAGVNLTAICAWGDGEKGMLMFLTDNNAKATEALKKAGFAPSEQEVVTTTLANQVGTLDQAAQKLARAEIDINYCYFTAAGDKALGVFSTKNNKKASELLG
jgi:hypothetical protein